LLNFSVVSLGSVTILRGEYCFSLWFPLWMLSCYRSASKNTLEMLERLREKMKVGTLDKAIRLLIVRQRKMMIDEVLAYIGDG